MDNISEPGLTMHSGKYSGETTVTSLRISKALLREPDNVAEQTGRTRNELISTCIEFTLEHIEIVDK